MGSVYLLVGVIVLTILHELGVGGVCPRQASEADARAKECLHSVGLSMEPASNSGGRSSDSNRLRQYCEDGTLDEAVMCVERIMKECQRENQDVSEVLSKSVSIEKLRSGFHYLCENIDILAESSECIAEQTQPISKCINSETKKFQTEIRSHQTKSQPTGDDIWVLSCRFMDRVFQCQETGFRKNCGDDVADVLSNFMQSVKPPICAQLNFSTRSAPSSYLWVPIALMTVACSKILYS